MSFFHGSNDGQKGVGLIMLILIGIVPTFFALDQSKNPLDLRESLSKVEYVMSRVNRAELSPDDQKMLAEIQAQTADLDRIFAGKTDIEAAAPANPLRNSPRHAAAGQPRQKAARLRKSEPQHRRPQHLRRRPSKDMNTFTDYAPWWVLLMVSLSLAWAP